MNIHDRAGLQHTAADRLRSSPGIWRLFALQMAVTLGAGLVVSLLNALLDMGIADAGGLSGMGTRSMLMSLGGFLESAVSLLLPFWEVGFLYLAIQVARQERPGRGSLLRGFRWFAPVLRLKLLQVGMILALSMSAAYLIAFGMTALPESSPVVQELLALVQDGTNVDPMAVWQLLIEHMLPLLLGCLVVLLAALAYFLFRFRLAEYAIVSGDTHRAFGALKSSWKQTRGHCLALLRLDLRFWWFYVLDYLVLAVFYLELFLELAGIRLPLDAQLLSWGSYLAYLVLRFCLYAFLKPRLQVTYALAYEELAHPQVEFIG